jgi:hypothetical protein
MPRGEIMRGSCATQSSGVHYYLRNRDVYDVVPDFNFKRCHCKQLADNQNRLSMG